MTSAPSEMRTAIRSGEQWAGAADGDAPRDALSASMARGDAALDEQAGKAVVAAMGIAIPKGVAVAADAIGADSLARSLTRLRPPFVVKPLSRQPIHKSDIGAVRLGLADAAAVSSACADVAARLHAADIPFSGFLVEETALPGVEIVIGGTTDPQLGPMLMLGAGGIYAEILRDTAFRLCPISRRDAREMIDALRIAPILRGARGRPAVDLAAIERALLALGGVDGLFTQNARRIAEFDINPAIARPDGLVAVDCRIVLHGAPTVRAIPRAAHDVANAFAPLFQPRAIAVAGASATGTSAGNRFIRVLQRAGFEGRIYPVHPSADTIEGLPAYGDLASTPTPVDYAYVTVPAGRVADVLGKAGGRVGFAQVMASTDAARQAEWETGLAALAAEQGFRLIGPNCMGTHSPRGRFTFMEGVSVVPGTIGIACQSGGLGMDILRRGQAGGLRFSGLVTIGNAVDVTPADLLEFYLADPETRVIGLYVEDLKSGHGQRFQQLVRQNAGRKPVVLLVGGVTGPGRKAAASHTGAMGASGEAWQALAAQSGAILTDTLDAFLDGLQMAQCLTPRPVRRPPTVTLFGNGGGASVLATDTLDRAGLRLAEPDADARRAFGEIALPPGASLSNPIDLPASVLKEEGGRVTARILDIDRRLVKPYASLVHLNLPVIMGYRHVENFLPNLMDSVFGGDSAQDADASHRVLVLRSDGSEEVDAWKRMFRDAAARRSVPSFDEIPQAIRALAAYHRYEMFLADAGCGQEEPS